MKNLYNIFEIQKTISFELIPFSKYNSQIDNLKKSLHYQDNPENFFHDSMCLLKNMEKILKKLKNHEWRDIFVEKIFFKELNSEIFYKNKQSVFSSENFLIKIFSTKNINNNSWISDFQTLFEAKIHGFLNDIQEIQENFVFYTDNIVRVTKSDKIRIMKQSIYKILKIISFLNFFHTRDKENYIYTEWRKFCDLPDNILFLKELNSVIASTKESGAIEWMHASINKKALKKRIDINEIQSELNILLKTKEKLESKKVYYTELITLWNEKYSQELTNERQRIEKRERNQQKIKKAIEDWRRWKSDYFVTEGTRKQAITDWKIFYSKKYGEIKQRIFAKEQEILNQQSIWYYSILLRRWWGYFLALMDKDNIIQLQNVDAENSAEFLDFSSLTFKALYKLLYTNTKDWKLQSLLKKPMQKRNEDENMQILNALKDALRQFGSEYNIDFQRLQQITNIDEFRLFVTENCYQRKWKTCDWDILIKNEKQGNIFLFQVYNKDMPFPEDRIIELKQKYGEDYIEKPQKPRNKENLFTQYWRECLEDLLPHIHISPEIKIFYRWKKEDEDLLKKKIIDPQNPQIGGSRYKNDKIIAEFKMSFYPSKKSTADDIQNKLKAEFNDKEVSFIGIDRGENSLANYMILDKNGNIKYDQEWKPLKWDMPVVTVDGRFIDINDCVLDNNENHIPLKWYVDGKLHIEESFTLQRFRRIYELIGEQFQNFLIYKDGRIKPDWEHLSLEDLIEIEKYLEEKIHPQLLRYREKNTGIIAFDYAYAFSWMRMLIKARYEKQMKIAQDKSLSEDEKRKIFTYLLDTISIKSGFVGHIVKALSDMVIQHNAYIVFESLNSQYSENMSDDFLSGMTFEKMTPKQQNQLKWLSVYHLIEQKIINKLNYLHLNNAIWLQTTPRINNLWLLRYPVDENGKILSQKIQEEKEIDDIDVLGNIVYISEDKTSRECPKCKEILFRNKSFHDKNHYYDQCYHTEEKPWKNGCDFDTKTHPYIKTADELAAYNIALRWLEKIMNSNLKKSLGNTKNKKSYQDKIIHKENDSDVIEAATYHPFKNIVKNLSL